MKNYVYATLFSLLFVLPSCMTTSTTVGTFTEDPGREYVYAKGKQLWLFWGLMPLGRTDVSTPSDGNCEVSSQYALGDFIISGLTCGILSSRTIKVKDKKVK
jgi:hypothetical protein